MNLVGCSIELFMEFIESQFEDWMNWENHGDWHLDHVRPCSRFNLLDSEQVSLCNNWRNFQPMDAAENMD